MTNMFKKTLIATAVLGFAGTATAADLTAIAKWFPQEVLSTVAVGTNGVASNAGAEAELRASFTYTMLANYAINDTIEFTFNGNAVLASSLPESVKTGSIVGDPAVDTEIVLSRISTSTASGNVVGVYRVTKIGADVETGTSGEAFVFADVKLLPRNLTGALSVSYKALTSTGLTLDNTGTAANQTQKLADVAQQFAKLELGEDNFNDTIDVEQMRKQFTDTTDPVLSVSVVDNKPETAPAFALSATVDSIAYTVNGAFGWLLDADGDVDADVAAVSFGGCAVDADESSVAADKIVVTCTNQTAPTITVAIAEDNNVVIPDQKFTTSAVVSYTAATVEGSKTISAIDSGEWDLNGSKVVVPYMLYGRNAEQTIQLTNLGTQSGDITVIATVGGVDLDLETVETSAAKSVTNINDKIRNAMIAKGVDLDVGNFAVGLTIVTNVPKEDVQVYSAYRRTNSTTDGGRQVVVNTSNGAGSEAK